MTNPLRIVATAVKEYWFYNGDVLLAVGVGFLAGLIIGRFSV